MIVRFVFLQLTAVHNTGWPKTKGPKMLAQKKGTQRIDCSKKKGPKKFLRVEKIDCSKKKGPKYEVAQKKGTQKSTVPKKRDPENFDASIKIDCPKKKGTQM